MHPMHATFIATTERRLADALEDRRRWLGRAVLPADPMPSDIRAAGDALAAAALVAERVELLREQLRMLQILAE